MNTETAPTTVIVSVAASTQLAVVPMHAGHHPIYASGLYQADVCNMIDDLMVCDRATGNLYRFPIDGKLYPYLLALVSAMNSHDSATGSPWADHNRHVREALMEAAYLRLQGTPPARNIFQPGHIAPALGSGLPSAPTQADSTLRDWIAERPECQVNADGNPF